MGSLTQQQHIMDNGTRRDALYGNERFQKSLEAKTARVRQRQQDMCSFRAEEGSWLDRLPDAPTFYPTAEEFADPVQYIRKLQPRVAAEHGICKIVPPVAPVLPAAMVLNNSNGDGKRFTFATRQQPLRCPPCEELAPRRSFETNKRYSMEMYERLAEDFARKRLGTAGVLPVRMIEAEYWRLTLGPDDMLTEFGEGLPGSAFAPADVDDALARSAWNLQTLPMARDSLLRLLRGDLPGITSPVLRIGMLFTADSWHTEDHDLHAVSYLHTGAPKVWYGVPAPDAAAFERAAGEAAFGPALGRMREGGASEEELRRRVAATLLDRGLACAPGTLMQAGVRVCRVVQTPGEFVVTFPHAYHASLHTGFGLAESACIAPLEWLPFGLASCTRALQLGRGCMLPREELLCAQAMELRGIKHGSETGTESGDSSEMAHAMPAAEHAAKTAFVRLMKQQHRKRAALREGGVAVAAMPRMPCSIPCAHCRDMVYLAAVAWPSPAELLCLTCALQRLHEAPAIEGAPEQRTPPATLLLRRDVGSLESLAREYERELRDARPDGRGLAGVVEAKDPRPFAELPLDGFHWADLPLPDDRAESADTTAALAMQDAGEGTDMSFLQDVAYLEGLIPKETEVQSPASSPHAHARAPPYERSGSKGALDEEAFVRALRSPKGPHHHVSNSGTPATSDRTAAAAAAVLALGPACNAEEPWEAQGPVRGSTPPPKPRRNLHNKRKRMSNLRLSDRERHEPLPSERHGGGRDSRDADSSAEGDRHGAKSIDVQAPLPAKRRRIPTTPGFVPKEIPREVNPSVAAAHCINTAATPLMMLVDEQINLASTNKLPVLRRRRIYARSRDLGEQRYLVAAEVVKAIGLDTKTSASNVVDRWFKDSAAKAAEHGLPPPALPCRAFCKGVHSPGSNGSYVITAQDVQLIAWILPDVQRKRLQVFARGVFPDNADPVGSMGGTMERARGAAAKMGSRASGSSRDAPSYHQMSEPTGATSGAPDNMRLQLTPVGILLCNGVPVNPHTVYEHIMNVNKSRQLTAADNAALELVSKAMQLQQMHSQMEFAAFPPQMLPLGAAPFPFPPYGGVQYPPPSG